MMGPKESSTNFSDSQEERKPAKRDLERETSRQRLQHQLLADGPATGQEQTVALSEMPPSRGRYHQLPRDKPASEQAQDAALPKQSRDRVPQECPYDIVLSCRLTDLCDDEQSKKLGSPGIWKFNVDYTSQSRTFEQWAGHVVGILGQYNKGKTWIMSRLSECQFPNMTDTESTEGISLKWVETREEERELEETDVYYHLVIDTAGLNKPVAFSGRSIEEMRKQQLATEKAARTARDKPGASSVGEGIRGSETKDDGREGNAAAVMTSAETVKLAIKRMQEREQSEHFLESMTVALSDYLIVVTGERTLTDQRFLLHVIGKWKEANVGQRTKCPEVFVLHNFRDVTDPQVGEELFKQFTQEFFYGRMRRVEGVTLFSCPDIRTRHVYLLNDRTNVEYNDEVFRIVKIWIHNVLPPPHFPCTPGRLAGLFADCSTRLLSRSRVLKNLKSIELVKTGDGEIVCKPVKTNKDQEIAIVLTDDDRFYSLQNYFRPTYSIKNYSSKAKTKCMVIQIEAPGVEKIRVKHRYRLSHQGHWAIEVSGNKEKADSVEVLKNSDELSGNDRLLPANDAEPIVESDARYGNFSKVFQIPLSFRKEKPYWHTIGPVNGIFYLVFEEEKMEESDEKTSQQ